MNTSTNYTTYTAEDFVWDEDFRNWVLQPDVENDIFWRNWINSNPDRLSIISAARDIVLSLRLNRDKLTEKDKRIMIDIVLSSVESSIDTKDEREEVAIPLHRNRVLYLSAAASILLVIVVGFWLSTSNSNPTTYKELLVKSDNDLIEQVNTSDTAMVVWLDDGTSITLEKNARISRVNSFHNYKEREIYLSGEAFFEVARDLNKPFYVYAGGMVTKVLGTSFRIRSYDSEEKATVEVRSGLVAVYSLNDLKPDEKLVPMQQEKRFLLTPNLKADYYKDKEQLVTTIVDNPVIISETKLEYLFVEMPLSDVFDRIRSGYEIEVIYDKTILGRRTLTANLEDLDLYQKLDVICKVTNSRYEVIDGKIVIHHLGQ